MDALIVVAALVATVTFAAAFTMPGGYKNEQGTAVLLKNAAFVVFVISDAIAMVLSTSALFIHFYWALLGKRGQVEEDIKETFSDLTSALTIWAIPAMLIAFIAGSYAVLAPSLWLAITTCFIGVSFIFFASKISHGKRYKRLSCNTERQDFLARALELSTSVNGNK
ncbi:hypothetical protein D5086_033813 [Populus alba]|uniref:Uncharacterized protein n=1 Tax=Populus alba TaxID=43335 RepID=A0ACC4AHW0_POPAL